MTLYKQILKLQEANGFDEHMILFRSELDKDPFIEWNDENYVNRIFNYNRIVSLDEFKEKAKKLVEFHKDYYLPSSNPGIGPDYKNPISTSNIILTEKLDNNISLMDSYELLKTKEEDDYCFSKDGQRVSYATLLFRLAGLTDKKHWFHRLTNDRFNMLVRGYSSVKHIDFKDQGNEDRIRYLDLLIDNLYQ